MKKKALRIVVTSICDGLSYEIKLACFDSTQAYIPPFDPSDTDSMDYDVNFLLRNFYGL